jgi:hypothetical protein
MSDIKGIEVQDFAGIAKPITKLIETVSQGIGILYEPIHIRRKAKAKADEIKIISSAVSNNLNLPTEYNNGSIHIDSIDANDLVKRAQSRFLFQEIQKQQNIESVIAGTYNILQNEENVDSKSVAKDWIIRFFNSVEDISDIDLQNLWSKILAGEVKRPKSFSMRTLDALRNISKDEAILFERVCKISMVWEHSQGVHNDGEFLKKYGVTYDDILRLDECGLLNSGFDMCEEAKIEANSKSTPILFNDNIIIIARPKSEKCKRISIGQHPFSKAGTEISQLYQEQLNDAVILDLAKVIKEENEFNYVNIMACRIIQIRNGSLECDDDDLLVENNEGS